MFTAKLSIYSLIKNKERKAIQQSFVPEAAARFNDVIFFWEKKGRQIFRIATSFERDDKEYISVVYEGKNEITICKKIYYPNNYYCLFISDEQNYAKILNYDENKKKFTVVKELYISSEFGLINSYYGGEFGQYVNGIYYKNT
jgi:CRISPR/Cas system-associated endonuclease/helicase Cas3